LFCREDFVRGQFIAARRSRRRPSRKFSAPTIISHLWNGHPLVPLSTLQAGYRLMMHGLDVEAVWLAAYSEAAAGGGLLIDPRVPTAGSRFN
jgi:hypothetical protein